MRKLLLDLHQLAVESFPTAAPERTSGTVRAHGESEFVTGCPDCTQRICPSASCDPAESCIDSCGDTCNCPTSTAEPTCGLTCFETC